MGRPLFTQADLISIYTRVQALADGVLVDVSATAGEAGFVFPVAITAGVWADCVTWTREDWPQDETGRLWDVIWMGSLTVRRARDSDRAAFTVLRVPNDVRHYDALPVDLIAVCGPGDDGEPVITIMLSEEL